MKKLLSLLTTLLTAIALFTSTVALADTPVVTQFHYDEHSHILSGKTSPDATINVNGMAGTITSDANGYFEVPIPKPMTSIKLFIIDENGNDNTVIYHRDKQGGHSHDNDLSAQHCPVDDHTTNQSASSVNQSTATHASSTIQSTAEVSTETQEQSTEPSTDSTQSNKKSSTSESQSTTASTTVNKEEEQPQKTHWLLWTVIVLVVIVLIAWLIHHSRHRYHRKH